MAVRERSVFVNKEYNRRGSSILADRDKLVADLNFPILHPINKTILAAYDIDAISNSIKNIVYTKQGDKPFQPSYGTQISDLLFEPYNHLIESEIKREIIDNVYKWEPRVRDIQVDMTMKEEENSLYITVTFLVGNDIRETVNITLTRQR